MTYSPRLLHLLLPGIIAFILCTASSKDNGVANAQGASSGPATVSLPSRGISRWVDTWGSMPQLTEPHNLPPSPFNTTGLVFANTTIRQTIRLTLGGDIFRLRISNAFGGSDLPITAVSISLPLNGSAGISAVQEGSAQRLTFSGESSVVVPMGALVVSDPVRVGGRGGLKPGTVVTVTIYSREGQTTNSITSHPGSRTTSWFIHGDYLDALDFPSEASEGVEAKAGVNHWYWISAVEVWTSKLNRALVIVGDSITDGRGSTDNGNNRYVS